MKRLSNLLAFFAVIAATMPAGAAGPKKIKQSNSFPIAITAPGSYILTSNITVPDENTTAISVQADYVTIDLNGFSIQSPVVCTGTPVTSCSPSGGAGDGVDGSGHVGGTVRNGSVHGMGRYGINNVHRVERITAQSNGNTGIRNSITVTNCIANSNGERGIGGASIAVDSTAVGNLSYGITVNDNVIDCIANGNGGGGIYALGAVSNCRAASNSGYGIAGPPRAVTNSVAYSNTSFGIDAITATGCMAAFNGGSPQISATGIVGHNICGEPGSPCP